MLKVNDPAGHGSGGGVQLMLPESCAWRPPSAVANATGFGCSWHADAGVVTPDDTVTVTDPPGAIVPKAQSSTLLAMAQVPCVVVMLVKNRPPLLGSWSCRCTLVALASPSLPTIMVKLTCPPCWNVPSFGLFTIVMCGLAGGLQ